MKWLRELTSAVKHLSRLVAIVALAHMKQMYTMGVLRQNEVVAKLDKVKKEKGTLCVLRRKLQRKYGTVKGRKINIEYTSIQGLGHMKGTLSFQMTGEVMGEA